MANNLSSNTSSKVMRVFLKRAEASRVLSKTVETSMFQGDFTPQYGDTIYVKRPHDYRAIRTSDGDISGSTKNSIISGHAAAEVQDYITVPIPWTNREEALQLDQLEEILAPSMDRAITELETSLASYMRTRAGLSIGTPGTAATTWEHVALAPALMQATGVPTGDWNYVMNPFTQTKLAGAQSAIYADSLVKTAWEKAQIATNFGGIKAISANTLSAFTNGTCADRAGTLSATPTATYVAHKDTMVQSLAVAGFSGNGVIAAGEVVEVTGRYRLNLATRLPVVDAAGAKVLWRATVLETVELDGDGAGTIQVSGPAIFEANGQYNTVEAALTSGDVITVLGASAGTVSPNLFYHKQAFALATVKLPKLNGWDTVGWNKDGFSARVTRYSDGDANSQTMRLDIQPAFATLNPFYAGLGYGS